MLVVAACGAVTTVVRVLLQAVDAVVGRHSGGVAYEACAALVVLLGQDHLLAPVAHDVAHEGRACACGGMGSPVALLRELGQTVAQHLGYHQVRAPAAAAGRVEPLALQVAVPPAALEHRSRAGLPRLIALAVIHELVGIAQYLVAFARGINVETGAAPHVVDARQIPLLDVFGCTGVIEQLPQECALLDGIDLQARTVGVNVREHVAVAVAYARTGKPARLGIHRVAALNHLVGAVAVHVSHTQLVELCRPWCLVVTAPGLVMMPIGRHACCPVILPGEHIVVVGLVVVTVQTLHNQRRMDAVEVANGKVAVHG